MALLLTGKWPSGTAKEGLEVAGGGQQQQQQWGAHSNVWAALLLAVLVMQLWVLQELSLVRGHLQQLQP
jgi:hypothetical protein